MSGTGGTQAKIWAVKWLEAPKTTQCAGEFGIERCGLHRVSIDHKAATCGVCPAGRSSTLRFLPHVEGYKRRAQCLLTDMAHDFDGHVAMRQKRKRARSSRPGRRRSGALWSILTRWRPQRSIPNHRHTAWFLGFEPFDAKFSLAYLQFTHWSIPPQSRGLDCWPRRRLPPEAPSAVCRTK